MPKSTAKLEEQIRLARQIQWQYQLDQYTDETLKQIQTSVTQAQKEITARLEHWAGHPTPTGWSEEHSNALLDELNRLTVGIQNHLTGTVAEVAGHAGSASLATHNAIVSWDGRAPGFNFFALTANQVRELALTTPVGGRLLQDWVARTFDSTLVSGIRREMLTGMLKGESYPDLIDRIGEGWGMTRHEATTLTRTYVQSANVGAMQRVYQENADIVKGVKWCATLEIGGPKGGGTCLECACLDGREYPLGEPNMPACPLHPRCRCLLLPQTLTWRELGLNIDEMQDVYRPWTYSELDIHEGRAGRVAMMGYHQGAFADLFEKLPREQQLNLLGPGRYGLLERGVVEFKDLVDPNTGELLLLKKDAEGRVVGLMAPRVETGVGSLISQEGLAVTQKTALELAIENVRATPTVDDLLSIGKAWREDNSAILNELAKESIQYKKNEIAEKIYTVIKETGQGQFNPAKEKDFMFSGMSRQNIKQFIKVIDEIRALTGNNIDSLRSVRYSKGIRAFAEKSRIVLSDSNRYTMFHEIGHQLEDSTPGLRHLAANYRSMRMVDNKGIQPMSNIVKGAYQSDERGINTNLIHKYAGKVYRDGSTEVISIGLEHFASGAKLSSLIKNDQGLFDFIIGVFQAGKAGLFSL